MLIENFNQTLDTWIKEVEKYSFAQLSVKPSTASWSLGQVYMHIIDVTDYYFEEIHTCTGCDENMNGEAAATARTMFSNNDLPDEIIEGPPSNADTPQPESKEQLLENMLRLKDELNKIGSLVATNQYKGKTKHIGLGWFNANEWLQFAEMHFRHHLRQKRRLDDYIKPSQSHHAGANIRRERNY